MTQATSRNTEGRVFQPPATAAAKAAPRTPEGRMIGSEFVRTKGLLCPKCDSDGITPLDSFRRVDAVKAAQTMTCNHCSSAWQVVLTLSGYDHFIDGKTLDSK